jgi:hypothetical protein
MAQWKTADDGVRITRISAALNPDHPYKAYLGDPLTDSPYCKSARGYKKIERLDHPCPPIVWPRGVGKDEDDRAEQTEQKQAAPRLDRYREGSRQAVVWKAFCENGVKAAYDVGLGLGLRETSLKLWTRVWSKEIGLKSIETERRGRKPVLTLHFYQEGGRLTLEVQPPAA